MKNITNETEVKEVTDGIQVGNYLYTPKKWDLGKNFTMLMKCSKLFEVMSKLDESSENLMIALSTAYSGEEEKIFPLLAEIIKDTEYVFSDGEKSEGGSVGKLNFDMHFAKRPAAIIELAFGIIGFQFSDF